MPKFRVVEEYPQATVTRTLIVDAPTKKEAEENPHDYVVQDLGYDVNEGGEAVTQECTAVKPKKIVRK